MVFGEWLRSRQGHFYGQPHPPAPLGEGGRRCAGQEDWAFWAGEGGGVPAHTPRSVTLRSARALRVEAAFGGRFGGGVGVAHNGLNALKIVHALGCRELFLASALLRDGRDSWRCGPVLGGLRLLSLSLRFATLPA